ncbi:MAG: phosphomannomutase/phosphoglucomutase [Cyanobacteria bacterium PR.3.49]|nr:phosphomannomutase/phosphoglucomutase [Cyanobacteria bacterium PR.3.49]
MMKEQWTKLFSSYDIRGVFGQEIDTEFGERLGTAFGALIAPDRQGRFIIGHDVRLSSSDMSAAFIRGLLEQGHEVVDLELASTPMISWCGWAEEFDGIASITASHLGSHYNGFKLSRRGAMPIDSKTDIPLLKELFFRSETEPRSGGRFKKANRLGRYVEMLKGFLHQPKRRIRLGVDVGNGAAGHEVHMLSELLASTVEIHSIFTAPDGSFPNRSSNPLDEGALDHLRRLVFEKSLDFGVALDGDADRCIVIDEQGQLVEPDFVLALIAVHLINSQESGSVVHDLRCSKSVAEHIAAAGGRAVATKVGYPNIRKSIMESRALFGGELSGHYYYGDMNGIDNALRTVVELINILGSDEAARPLSQFVQPLKRFHGSGEITIHSANAKDCIEDLKTRFADAPANYLDGITVDFGEWWFNARASGTESAVRLIVESNQASRLTDRVEALSELIAGVSPVPASIF